MSTPEPPIPDRPETTPPAPPGTPHVPPAVPPVAPPPPSGWGDTPRYGQYGQLPQYGQAPQYGTPGQQQPAPGPYGTPPHSPYARADKPGIVPLRPLTLGEIYDGAFSAVRHNPAVMLGLATLILLVASIVGVLVGQLLVPAFGNLFGSIFAEPVFEEASLALGITVGSLAQVYGSTSGLLLATLLTGPVVNGILTVSVSRSVLGDKATVREVWSRVAPRVWVLLGWSILQGVGLTAVAVGLVVVLVLLVALLSEVSAALAGVFAIVLAFAMLATIAWLVVRLLLVPPALALEGTRLWATVKRGWLLTRGSFWRVLGITLLASVIVYFISQAIAIPLGLVGSAIPWGTGGLDVGTLIIAVISGVIGTAIETIFLAGVTALLYIDLRMRREGLDVQLTAAAGERQG